MRKFASVLLSLLMLVSYVPCFAVESFAANKADTSTSVDLRLGDRSYEDTIYMYTGREDTDYNYVNPTVQIEGDKCVEVRLENLWREGNNADTDTRDVKVKFIPRKPGTSKITVSYYPGVDVSSSKRTTKVYNVTVHEFSLNKTQIELIPGEETTIDINYDGIIGDVIKWSTSDSSIVDIIKDGTKVKIKAIKVGIAKISVTIEAKSGPITAECTVKVEAKPASKEVKWGIDGNIGLDVDGKATIEITSGLPKVARSETPTVLFLGSLCAAHSLGETTIKDTINTIAEQANVDYRLFGLDTLLQYKADPVEGLLPMGEKLYEDFEITTPYHVSHLYFADVINSVDLDDYDLIILEFDGLRMGRLFTDYRGFTESDLVNQLNECYSHKYYEYINPMSKSNGEISTKEAMQRLEDHMTKASAKLLDYYNLESSAQSKVVWLVPQAVSNAQPGDTEGAFFMYDDKNITRQNVNNAHPDYARKFAYDTLSLVSPEDWLEEIDEGVYRRKPIDLKAYGENGDDFYEEYCPAYVERCENQKFTNSNPYGMWTTYGNLNSVRALVADKANDINLYDYIEIVDDVADDFDILDAYGEYFDELTGKWKRIENALAFTKVFGKNGLVTANFYPSLIGTDKVKLKIEIQIKADAKFKFETGKSIIFTNDGKAKVKPKDDKDRPLDPPSLEEPIHIQGEKTWIDDNNKENIRPESINITLYANGKKIKSKIVTPDAKTGKWTWDFGYFKTRDESGKVVKYTITEDAVDGYSTIIDGFNVTNKHTSETVEIKGKKTWDDSNNKAKQRPESITVNLFADGVQVDSKTVTAANNWKWSFTGLPKNNGDSEIVYTVEEEEVKDYSSIVDGYNITNKYSPDKRDIKVRKVWLDGKNRDGNRPEKITINLFANGQKIRSQEVTGDSSAYIWTCVFENLPRYDSDNQPISYTIDEDNISGYNKRVVRYTIFNEIPVKSRIDRVPERVEVSGSKTWNDNNDQDGKRPDSITINLLANGEQKDFKTVTATDGWKWSFTRLPKYDKNGKEIEYTITEDPVYNYQTKINGYNVINTYSTETVSIEGKKTWRDVANKNKERPKSVVVNLYADGKEVASRRVSALNRWKWSFTGLPKYSNGSEIVYTIEEEEVNNYSAYVNGYNVTNIYSPDKRDITIRKVWLDEKNIDGSRPKEITVNLYANGKKIDSQKVKGDDSANIWTAVFKDVPRYDEKHRLIVYTIDENDISGYDYTKRVVRHTIFNRHVPKSIDISGSKTWKDDNDRNEKRPDSITINLLANGVQVDSKTVTAENDWAWTFSDLPGYKNGKQITYTITEDAVTGYETKIDGYDVTNTYKPSGDNIDKPSDDDGDKPSGDDVDKPSDDDVRTGDDNNLLLFMLMAFLSSMGIVVCGCKTRRSNKKH